MNTYEEIVKGMMIADCPSDFWLTTFFELPELEVNKGIIQRNRQSVYKHTMAVIDVLETKNNITLLSGLFHDLGKYYVDTQSDQFGSRFPNHDKESERITRNRLIEWGASNYIIDSVCRIVSTHMLDLCGITREKTIRKFVAKVGKENIDNWFTLRVADSQSYYDPQIYKNRFIEPFRDLIISYLKKQPDSRQMEFEHFDVVGGIQIKGGDEE